MSLAMPRIVKVERPRDGFGARLWDVLYDAGVEMRWSTIARALGVTDPQVRKYFNEGEYPRMPAAIAIAEEYDVSVDWLLTGRGEKRPGTALTPFVIEAVGAVERHCAAHDLDLPAEDRLRLVNYLIGEFTGLDWDVELADRKLQSLYALGSIFSQKVDGQPIAGQRPHKGRK